MKTVWKYEPTVTDLDLGYRVAWVPGESRVVMVGEQLQDATGTPTKHPELPRLWVEQPVPGVSDARERVFLIVGTGHDVPPGFEHVGSAVCAGGSLCWHVYGEPFVAAL